MDINHPSSYQSTEDNQLSTQIKVRLKHMFKIADGLNSNDMSKKEALDSLLTTLSELRRFSALDI